MAMAMAMERDICSRCLRNKRPSNNWVNENIVAPRTPNLKVGARQRGFLALRNKRPPLRGHALSAKHATLSLGVRGAFSVGEPLDALGVYFADTGYPKTVMHGYTTARTQLGPS